ncbi:MAG: helix-turn-helix domain-containing protein [Victivallaceae bacterium]
MKETLPLFDDDPPEKELMPAVPAEAAAVSSPEPVSEPVPEPVSEPSPVRTPVAAAPVRARAPIPAPPPANGSFGAYLRDLRLRNGFTIDQIAQETRIGTGYLNAIEREDYGDLPPPVYVLAYVKMLCAFYRLDEASTEVLTAELRQRLEIESQPPENPDKLVVDMESSQENPILLKRILLVIGIALFLLVALITVLALVFVSPDKPRSADPVAVTVPGGSPALLDEKQLLEIQPPPKLEVHVLPAKAQ